MKPYGYVRKDGEGLFIYGEHQFQNVTGTELVPVYLHPKEWVGLTEQEHTDIAVECGCMSADWVFYGAAVERKVKERNT